MWGHHAFSSSIYSHIYIKTSSCFFIHPHMSLPHVKGFKKQILDWSFKPLLNCTISLFTLAAHSIPYSFELSCPGVPVNSRVKACQHFCLHCDLLAILERQTKQQDLGQYFYWDLCFWYQVLMSCSRCQDFSMIVLQYCKWGSSDHFFIC